MSVKVFQIDHNSKYLSEVIALGDVNKSTLGFFPKDAYIESASKKRIIIAVDEGTEGLAGYLLYSVSRQKMLVSIVHMCVNTLWRGGGVTKLLFDELKRITQDGYLGVRVRCRVDYSANKLWPKLGFLAMGEMDGRGKKGTRLTVWKFEYDQPSLFSYALQQNESKKVKVVIDANVLYQLQFPENPENEESLPLLEPWLDVDLYITPEIYNEIDRSKDKRTKEATRKFADSFMKVDSKSSQGKFQKSQENLRPLFPKVMTPRDESDLRQLAYAISADIPFFVTRDEPMLGRADDVFENFGIQMLRPSDLVLMQDELLRGDDYAPSRLAGSQIRIEKVHAQQSEKCVQKFLSPQSETKNKFNKKLQLVLSNVPFIETFIVIDGQGEEHGLISYSRQYDDQLVIPIFRVGQFPICRFVAKYLVNELVLTASVENRSTIKVSEEFLSPQIALALQESGFFQLQDCWVKITLQGSLSVRGVIARLLNSTWPDYLKETIANLISTLNSSPNQATLQEVEKGLWPLKISDIDLPVFIVPIRPEWAMHLFDVDIAAQDLFGGEPSLILNAENVYYRSGFQKILSAPGRVLWYVSAGSKRYQNLMYVKACSYLDDVEIGKPKQLFSKYKKLGIYKWKDVYNGVAKGNLNKDIMAFKFSKTEIFKTPINLLQLQQIWKAEGKNFNNAISPLLISKENFFKIYDLGMKGQ
jgi:predicted nucleic acid-binding protein